VALENAAKFCQQCGKSTSVPEATPVVTEQINKQDIGRALLRNSIIGGAFADPKDGFAGVFIDRKTNRILRLHRKEAIQLAGAQATVETAGQLDKRVTMTRFVLTGPLAFALRKTKDNRQLSLTIEGVDGVILVDLSPSQQKKARKFAARVNTAAKTTARRSP